MVVEDEGNALTLRLSGGKPRSCRSHMRT